MKMSIFFPVSAAALLLIAATPVSSLNAAAIPLLGDFIPSIAADVRCLAVQPDGNILVGGSFTTIDYNPGSPYLASLTPSGAHHSYFHPNLNGPVTHIALREDGSVMVAGSFTHINGTARNGLACLDETGAPDPGFAPYTPAGPVSAMLLKPDGKLLLAGSTSSNTYWLVQLSASGNVDPSFNTTVNGKISCLALQSNGQILLGGEFTQVKGLNFNRLARINAAGTPDSSFNPDVDGKVSCLGLQPTGEILLAGDFATVSGRPRLRVARLSQNGTLDSSFVLDTVLNSAVESMALQADGRVVVGGGFEGRAFLLSSAGKFISSYNVGSITSILALAPEKTGRMLLGGISTPTEGYLRRGELNSAPAEILTASAADKVRWSRGGSLPELTRASFDRWNGSSWIPLGSAIFTTGAWELKSMALPAGTWIRARGATAGGQNNGSAGRVEFISPYGTVPDISLQYPSGTPLSTGSSSIVWPQANWLAAGETKTITVQNTGTADLTNIAVSVTGAHPGDFLLSGPGTASLAPGASAAFTLKFLPRGGGPRTANLHLTSSDYDEAVHDVSLQGLGIMQDAGFQPSFNSDVWNVALSPEGQIYAAGKFTQVNGQSQGYLARLNANGTLDPSFLPVFNHTVRKVKIQADGKIIVSGDFSSVNGTARDKWARLNPDGSLDNGFNLVPAAPITDFQLLPSGKIMAITTYYDQSFPPYSRLDRLNSDGSYDSSFNPLLSVTENNGYFQNMAVQADGKILVTGNFARVNGAFRRNVARFLPDGALDTSFVPLPSIGIPNSIAIQPDGKILVAGRVKIIDFQAQYGIIRLNADGSLDSTFTVPDYSGEILGLQVDGKIIMGMMGTNANGHPDVDLLRLLPDGTRDPYFNLDTNNPISSAVIATDGQILIGGGFTSAGGVTRNRLARIPNNISASQTFLAADSSRLVWNRSGAAPEVGRVFFEKWNGSGWSILGEGTRLSGGWELTGLSLGQAGYLRVHADSVGYVAGTSGFAAIEQTHVFNFTGIALTPVELWRIEHFGTQGDEGTAANTNDYDGDGVPNLLEYALGTDPSDNSSAASPEIAIESVEGVNYLTMTIDKPAETSGIDYVPETSTDLVTWNSGPDYLTVIEDSTGLLKVRLKDSTNRSFLRLRIVEQ